MPVGSDEGVIDGAALQRTVSPVTALVAGDGTALSVTEKDALVVPAVHCPAI
jgi:hypothetical protein